MMEFLEEPADSRDGHPREEGPFRNRRAESAYIHASAVVDAPCEIGENTVILHFTHVMPHAIIGRHCHIGHNVTIASGVVIGDDVRVMDNTLLTSGTILESQVYCGPSTVITPLDRIRAETRNLSSVSPTLVRTGASIGPNTTLAAGVTVGSYAFIEAGSVVDRNVSDFALVFGNPMKFGGWRCACGKKLTFEEEAALCGHCGKHYAQKSAHKIVALPPRSLEKRQAGH